MSFVDRSAVIEVAGQLTDIHKRVLAELSSDHGQGPSHIANATGLPVREAREVLRFFRFEGVCQYGTLWDDYAGLCCGSGYWLDRFGLAVRAEVLPEFAQ